MHFHAIKEVTIDASDVPVIFEEDAPLGEVIFLVDAA